MPVRIPLAEVGKMINTSVGDLIYQDDTYTDNNNDQLKLKVWKTAPIKLLGGKNKNIIIEVPLRIWAEKGIGTLGVYSYQNTTFETTLYFSSVISLNNNWTMSTHTSSLGFKWVTKPVLDYGKIKIPITPIVEKSLKEQQEEFCKTIDKQMAGPLNFKKYAVDAWNFFATPINISEEYHTWLKVTPLAVNITPPKFYADAIDLNLGIDVFSETYTGSTPPTTPVVSSIADFKTVSTLSNTFSLQTTANILYSEATRIAEKTFLNKEFDFREGKSKVKVTEIKVSHELNRLMVEITTEGSVNGTALVSGIPVYDAALQKIVLSDTKFHLKTKNILQKMATLLFKGKIVKMIEEEYGIPTKELEDSSKKSLLEALNKDYQKGLKLKGSVFNLKPTKILINDNGMTILIETRATIRVLINKITI